MIKVGSFIESECLDLAASLLAGAEMRDILIGWVETLEYEQKHYAKKSHMAGMSAVETAALLAMRSILDGGEADGLVSVPKKLLSLPKSYRIMDICASSGEPVPEGLQDLLAAMEAAREGSGGNEKLDRLA